jgi:hypothetical protein
MSAECIDPECIDPECIDPECIDPQAENADHGIQLGIQLGLLDCGLHCVE